MLYDDVMMLYDDMMMYVMIWDDDMTMITWWCKMHDNEMT